MKLRMPKLSISTKLYMIIVVITLCMIVIGFFAFYKISNLAKLNDDIMSQPYTVGLVLRDVENAVISIDRDIRLFPYTKNKFERFNLLSVISEADQKIMSQLHIIEERIPENISSINEARKLVIKWRLLRRKVRNLMELGKIDEAIKIVDSQSSNFVSEINYFLAKMRQLEVGSAFKLSQQSRSFKEQIIKSVTFAFIVTIVISSTLVFLIARSIVQPTRAISRVMKELSEEHSDKPIPYTNRMDEIGAMARSTEVFRQYYQSIVKLNEQLQETDKLKSEFFAKMNHELRTPLNGIMGMCQLLAMSDLNEQQNKNVDIILSSSKSLLHIVNDLLDFSTLQADQMEFCYTEFNIRDIIDKVITTNMPYAEEKHLRLESRISAEIDRFYIGDQVRIRQVLNYLIRNAIKFTSQGRVTVIVEPTSDDRLCFRVLDTGIGIEKEHQEFIFDRFRQVDGSVYRQYGGTGLGLAIAKELVAHMDGKIGVDSTPGAGSEFWFKIPLKKPEENTTLSAASA